MAVARSVAASAADGVDQGFLLWLWALMSSDAGHTLTQLDDQAAEEDAHVVCMTEVTARMRCRTNPSLPILRYKPRPCALADSVSTVLFSVEPEWPFGGSVFGRHQRRWNNSQPFGRHCS